MDNVKVFYCDTLYYCLIKWHMGLITKNQSLKYGVIATTVHFKDKQQKNEVQQTSQLWQIYPFKQY